MKNIVNRFVREEDGQDLIEYSLLAALIAVACIVAMNTLATDINEIFAAIGAALDGGASSVEEIVAIVYADVDRALWPAATLSVRAQLDYLRR